MYATHSQYFLEAKHFDQIYRLVRSNNGKTYQTSFNHATMEDIEDEISPYYHKKIYSALENIYTKQLPIGIFSSEVILTEGSTDKVVLERIAEKIGHSIFNKYGISVIDCGSKSSIIMHYAILHALGIPTIVVFDNDSGWDNRTKNKGDKLEEEKKSHDLVNQQFIKYFGIPTDQVTAGVPNSGIHDVLTSTYMYVVDDTLEPFLLNHCNGWTEAFKSAQKELEISSIKSSEVYAEAISQLSLEQCPKDIIKFIENTISLC